MNNLIFKCNKHPSYDANLIRFHKDISQVLSCACCIEEQDDLVGVTSISFQKVIEATQQTFFSNWPLYEKEASQQLKEKTNHLFLNANQIRQQRLNNMTNFFKDLRDQIEKKISTIQFKCFQLLQNEEQLEKKFLAKYNEISKKADIQRILCDESKSVQKKNQELKKIVDHVIDHKRENTQKMLEISNLIESNKSINLGMLEKVKRQVLSNLDLFSDYMDNNQKENYDLQQQISMSTLSQILRNKFNQFSVSFTDTLEQALSSNFYLFTEIFQQPIFQSDFININYDNLQDHHFKDILKLAQTISLLSSNEQQQIRSQYYKNTNSLMNNFLNRISQKSSVQDFLMRYPIFEMIPEIQEKCEQNFQLFKSNYNQSIQLFQIQNSNTLYSSADYTYMQLQAYCDFIINPKLKYIFKIQISQSANRQNLKFGFGLGRDSLAHHNIYEQKLMYYSDGQWGIDQLIKGQNLTEQEVSRSINYYTVKLCQEENKLEVSDTITNHNIISINQQTIQLLNYKDLRFFVNLSSDYKKGDWISVQSIEIVKQFIQN